MKNYLTENYDFKMRLASKAEIDTLASFLAGRKWEEKQTVEVEASDKEEVAFIKKEKSIILKLIRGKVMVQDYKKFNIAIFVYNYIEERGTDVVLSVTFRVLQTERGMEYLENEDTVFDFNMLRDHPYHDKKSLSGRHKRPKNESIQKALEIRNYLRDKPRKDMDRICKEFGMAKTTFYRTDKWLEERYN